MSGEKPTGDAGDAPMQTTPKGAEIPIPTRDAVLRDLQKVAPPVELDDDEKRD